MRKINEIYSDLIEKYKNEINNHIQILNSPDFNTPTIIIDDGIEPRYISGKEVKISILENEKNTITLAKIAELIVFNINSEIEEKINNINLLYKVYPVSPSDGDLTLKQFIDNPTIRCKYIKYKTKYLNNKIY